TPPPSTPPCTTPSSSPPPNPPPSAPVYPKLLTAPMFRRPSTPPPAPSLCPDSPTPLHNSFAHLARPAPLAFICNAGVPPALFLLPCSVVVANLLIGSFLFAFVQAQDFFP